MTTVNPVISIVGLTLLIPGPNTLPNHQTLPCALKAPAASMCSIFLWSIISKPRFALRSLTPQNLSDGNYSNVITKPPRTSPLAPYSPNDPKTDKSVYSLHHSRSATVITVIDPIFLSVRRISLQQKRGRKRGRHL